MAQHMDALAKANRVRIARAQFKRQVRAREASAVDTILDPPPLLESMAVGELLRAQPAWGKARTMHALENLADESTPLGALSRGQRAVLSMRLTVR